MIHRDLAELIARHDPDGKSHRPTPSDKARFEAWVVTEFGAHTLQAYYRVPVSGTYLT